MALLNDIKRDFGSFVPKNPPTFLSDQGEWESEDGGLYVKLSSTNPIAQRASEFLMSAKRDIPNLLSGIGVGIDELLGLPGRFVTGFNSEVPKGYSEQVGKAVEATTGSRKLGIGAGFLAGFISPGPDELKNIKRGKNFAKGVDPFVRKERGFVTSVKEEFPKMKVAGQYIPRSTDRLAIKAKNLIKDNVEDAERMALTRTDDDAVAVGAELVKFYGRAAQKAKGATRMALYDKGAEFANTMARNLTEQGRAVQAASILGRLTPEGQVRFAAREIQKYNDAIDVSRGGYFGLKKKIPEITGEQTKYITDEMKAIEQMADGTEKAMRFQGLQNYVSDLVPTSFLKKMTSLWKAGLLTGIKTSGVNIFANLSHAKLERIKDIPAFAIDEMASFFTGKRTVSPTLRGSWGGVKEGLDKGWRYLKTGFDERNIGAKLDYKRVNFGKGPIARSLQAYEETVFRVIGAEDQPFYYAAKARSIADQATAQGVNSGFRGDELDRFVDTLVRNPTDEMARYAVLDAETAVFQNDTKLGRIARGIQNLGGGAGEIVVPFARTPSAVVMQVINYSPVGIVKTLAENIGKGKFDQRLFAQGLARGLTGTGILWIGTELGKSGLVSLDRPKDEREQMLWEAEGRTSNSIKVNGVWRSPQVLGPAGNLLLVGAHFQRAFEDSGSPTEAALKGIFGSAKSFTEQTFLRGVNQVVEALNDPQRSGEGYLGSVLSSAVPTIISDVARGTDPVDRRPETILQRIQARVPGLRQNLEPRVDVLGEEVKRAGNFFAVMADPTRPSPEKNTPLLKELRRLQDAGYKVSPTKLGDKKGFPALTRELNTDLWKRAGEITRNKLLRLIQLEEYKKLEDDLKTKKITEVIDWAKLISRTEKVLELTEGLTGTVLKKKLSELKEGKLLNGEVLNKYMELR